MGSAPFMLYRTGEAIMLARGEERDGQRARSRARWTGSLDVGGNADRPRF